MDISAIISSLTYAQTLAGLLINERDSQKAAAIKIELTEKILGAQTQLAQVFASVIEKDTLIQTLTERNRNLEAAQREKERYRLDVVGSTGVLAYRLRPVSELVERADEPPHLVCQACFDSIPLVKSVLQPNGRMLHCRVNPAHNIRTSDEPPIRAIRSHNPFSGDF